MHPYLLLGLAIVAEVVATTSLKASQGFTRLWPSLVVIAGYGVAFYAMSLVLKAIKVGVVYAVWSGLGIVLITLVSAWRFGEKLDSAAWLGIVLIVAGVLVMNLFSNTAVIGNR